MKTFQTYLALAAVLAVTCDAVSLGTAMETAFQDRDINIDAQIKAETERRIRVPDDDDDREESSKSSDDDERMPGWVPMNGAQVESSLFPPNYWKRRGLAQMEEVKPPSMPGWVPMNGAQVEASNFPFGYYGSLP